MNTTKTVSVICIFSTLITGCYSSTVVTSDTPQPDNQELVFTLLWIEHDRTKYAYENGKAYVVSDQHRRIENGYEVTGKLVTPEDRSGKSFSGVLYDDQIKEVTVSEYNALLTWVIIGGVAAAVVLFLATMELDINPFPTERSARYGGLR